MGSINNQIDNAVIIMKGRAALFNDKWSMEGVRDRSDYLFLLSRAEHNLKRAQSTINPNPEGPLHLTTAQTKEFLVDTMNLCALALSILTD